MPANLDKYRCPDANPRVPGKGCKPITYKTFLLLGTLLQAQTLDLVQPPNLSVCTGDSLKITMTIGSNNFNAGNQFIVLFDDGLLTSFDVTVADTLAIERWQSITPSPVGTSADTLTAGVKYFWIIVPADITSNNFYSQPDISNRLPWMQPKHRQPAHFHYSS